MCAWVRLDDQFADHPKIVAAGPLASWLYVCGLTYAARLMTDGFIPSGQVRKLAGISNAQKQADALVSCGLWDAVDGGYTIHDYLDYNPSREKTVATREARAAAGSVGGKQKASNLLERGQTPATEMFKQNSTPSPSPSPPHPRRDTDTPPIANAKAPKGAARGGRIPAQWPSTEGLGEMLAYGAELEIAAETVAPHIREFHDYWSQATKNATSLDWVKRWRVKFAEDVRIGRVGGSARASPNGKHPPSRATLIDTPERFTVNGKEPSDEHKQRVEEIGRQASERRARAATEQGL